MKLGETKEGESYYITKIYGSPQFQMHICSVGIVPGDKIEVVQNMKGYPVLLYQKSTLLAISKKESDKIEVEVVV